MVLCGGGQAERVDTGSSAQIARKYAAERSEGLQTPA